MERMTLSQAKKLGLKRYMPLRRCASNHDCWRVTRFDRCTRCFSQRQLRLRNRNFYEKRQQKIAQNYMAALWGAARLDIWLQKNR
jgi:hypothetical protein